MEQRSPILPKKEKEATTEIIFKYVFLALLGFLIFCIPGFLKFRELVHNNGFYFVHSSAWLWSLVGFTLFGAIKYSYFVLVKKSILGIIHPKYQGDERLYRARSVSKLSFDTIFYTVSSLSAFLLFRKEYWFPDMIGGEGKCEYIYRQYPNWPSITIAPEQEIFYTLQLGIHAFGIFQSIFIKGKTDRKYYQFLLHHFVATSLILFSLLTNNVAVGTVILFLHDFSDITAAFVRGLSETKYNHVIFDFISFIAAAFNWFYMRAVVFPFCLIKNMAFVIPDSKDSWVEIKVQISFLVFLCSILVCMHLFWFFFLMQAGYLVAIGKGKRNTHDSEKVKH